MMGWALAILFIAAIVLLILSIRINKESSKKIEQQIEDISFTFMGEVNKLQEKLRAVELDIEITASQAGVDPESLILLREVLDLYKRGYSVESIAEKQQLSVNEVEQFLSPFKQMDTERRGTANDV